MYTLSIIQTTVLQIAEAITEALGIETEIIDNKMRIIGGTGRYKSKIGTFEENGDLNSGFIYSRLLKTGEEYINLEPAQDQEYNALEGELAELCCPVKYDDKVIGLIGLVAFTEDQKGKIIENKSNLFLFLNRMAYLIASKLAESKNKNELIATLESIHDGIISVNKELEIVSCNYMAKQLLGKYDSDILGQKLSSIWSVEETRKVIRTGVPVKDKEEIYEKKDKASRHFLCTIMPIVDIKNEVFDDVMGAVISFQDISEVRTRIYHMAHQNKVTCFDDIIGNSKGITEAKKRAAQVSSSNSTVLITGESGTGKEIFARSIHFASPRKENSFITVNCGAIPETLLESELFGYDKGAFTGAEKSKPGKFELADKGTIFLDEVGDMPLHLQVKLLHVIQNRQIQRLGGTRFIPIDVRIVAATNKNLEEMILKNEFREDLFFRLNVIPIHIPSLSSRHEDILILLEHALNKFNKKLNKGIRNFHQDALHLLLKYEWPGNVRELENVVEYSVNMVDSGLIYIENLPERIQSTKRFTFSEGQSLKTMTEDFQRKIIIENLQKTGYSVKGKKMAARKLGISETTLYRRIKELNI